MRMPRFGVGLGLVAILAFGVRLAFGHYADHRAGFGDDWWYHLIANWIAGGHGFTNPLETLVHGRAVFGHQGASIPTAYHPPLFPVVLAGFSKLGLSSYEAQRAVGCALGACTTVVVGLIGRRLAGPPLGLAAALVAALYLPLVANDSVLLSESLYGLTIALTIWTALRFLETPTYVRAGCLGAAIGLAALTRSEAVLLVVLLLPFAVRRARLRPVRNFAMAAGVVALLVVPWSVRNSIVFHRPTTVTTGDGSVIGGANTHATYYGALLGGWDPGGLRVTYSAKDRYNEAATSAVLRRRGLRYAGDHAGRLPVVLAARGLRTWGLYPLSPAAQVRFAAFLSGNRTSLEWARLVMTWAAIVLSVAGVVALRRRGAPLAPLLAPVVLVTLVSLAFNGDVRYRDAADVSMAVLATVGAAAVVERVRRSRTQDVLRRRRAAHVDAAPLGGR